MSVDESKLRLSLDECLLLDWSEDDFYALWEAAWIYETDKKERADKALRTLIENGLAVFIRMKSWREQIPIELTAEEQKEILENLHNHEDWEPGGDVNKTIIWYYITEKGKLLYQDDYVRTILKEYREKLAQ